MDYILSMTSEKSHLRTLRERAGLSVRELASQIKTHHTTLSYWERTGKVGNTEFIAPIASALGVSVEEVLGLPKQKKNSSPGGKLGQTFEAASKLSRRQQQKIVDIVAPFIREHAS